MRAQLGLFAVIGTISTPSYIALYALLRRVLLAFDANPVSLCIAVVGNAWANRRFTFRRSGSQRWAPRFTGSAMVFGAALIISSAALAVSPLLWRGSGVLSAIVTVLVSGLLATIVRFALLACTGVPSGPCLTVRRAPGGPVSRMRRRWGRGRSSARRAVCGDYGAGKSSSVRPGPWRGVS
ncbi:GtrA family protein [Frankia tisae]